MTDKAKALGLPTDQEIEEILTPLTPQSKGFYFEQRLFGAKLMRDRASSRIKEVACEFAEWEDSYLKEWNTNPKLTLREHEERLKMTTEQRFDLFIKERNGE